MKKIGLCLSLFFSVILVMAVTVGAQGNSQGMELFQQDVLGITMDIDNRQKVTAVQEVRVPIHIEAVLIVGNDMMPYDNVIDATRREKPSTDKGDRSPVIYYADSSAITSLLTVNV